MLDNQINTNPTPMLTHLKFSDLSQSDKSLVLKAKEMTANSYAPYSSFNVGAAVLMQGGEVYTGANQENAAYPSCLCAERVALLYATANNPNNAPIAIAIAAYNKIDYTEQPVSPCGECRQVLLEMQKRYQTTIRIIMYGRVACCVADSADDLLPAAFL